MSQEWRTINVEVLEKAKPTSIESMKSKAQLRWTRHMSQEWRTNNMEVLEKANPTSIESMKSKAQLRCGIGHIRMDDSKISRQLAALR